MLFCPLKRLRCLLVSITVSLAVTAKAFAVPLSELKALLCQASLSNSVTSKPVLESFFQTLGPRIAFSGVSVTHRRDPVEKPFPKTTPALRIATYNVENEKYMPVSNANKLERLVQQMNAIDADVWMIEEVGSQEDLELLAQNLEGEFQVAFAPGNDENRHLGVIARKQHDLHFVVQSHQQLEVHAGSDFVFNRDLPVIIALGPDDRPRWMVFGTHYKSRRASEDKGEGARKLQVESSIALIEAYRLWAGDDVPVLIAGDFNDDLEKAAEFQDFWNSGWTNPMKGQPTHFWAKRKKGRVDQAFESQLDGILVHSRDTFRVIQKGVLENPLTTASRSTDAEERKQFNDRPSDHLPLFIDLESPAVPRR